MNRLKTCLILLMFLLSAAHPSHSCAVLSTETGDSRVNEETAFIIWDEKQKTQHFIRQATFETTAKDIGFLVPTPSVPELGEAEEEIFWRLEEYLRPKVVYEEVERYRPGTILYYLFGRRVQTVFNSAQNALNTSTGVEVISEQRVAGYEAAILRANNVGSLQRWLKKNKYVSGPAFEKWLQPYVEKGWIITAFKYAKKSSTQYLSSDAVRMSFKTERPFFPYREPQQPLQKEPRERLLRVFLLASQRMDGQLAKGGWPHKVPFAKPLSRDDLPYTDGIPQVSRFIQPGWLTVFEDRATVRSNAGDLFWQLSKQQTPAEPPPIIKERTVLIYIPVEPFLLLIAGVGWLVWQKRSPR